MTFRVYGMPQSAGSKRAFPFKRKDGRIGVAVSDDNPKAKGWKQEVAYAARKAKEHQRGGEVMLSVVFHMPRPKSHYGSGRNSDRLKPSAPLFPAVKPDLLKLTRAVEDALTGIAWKDDAQIVEEHLRKAYSTGGPYVEITVTGRGE